MHVPHHLPLREVIELTDIERPTLTHEQEQAVARRQGSLLLAAGAGSGKTAVLVERFVRAVLEDGITPGRILAITFTERAAGELRERVRKRLLELGAREAAREAEGAFVSTFHGFCARLLRIHPLQAGVEPGFQILDDGLAGRLRTFAFSDALKGFLEGEHPPAVDLVAAYGADSLRSMVLGAYAQLRSEGQSEPRLLGISSDHATALQACRMIGELLERFGVAYSQRKHARAALDFDDLELRARVLLERRAQVREAWAERFQLLMVDEFQDTNPRQLQILAALDRDNLFTVGDELQSIYGFRHANVTLFRERRTRLAEGGSSLALTHNFRSRPSILAAVERVFAERMGERFAPLVPARVQDGSQAGFAGGPVPADHGAPATVPSGEPLVELLLTDKRGWESLPANEELEGLPDAPLWRQAEARLLAGRVDELVKSGRARAGDVVVLLRALGDLPVYESALRRRGLPTLAGVGGFWGHQQVGDLLSWLRALANPLDELALYSTLASPLVRISSDGLALLAGAARERRWGVWQTIERAFGGDEVNGDGDPSGSGSPGGGSLTTDLHDALAPVDRERLTAFCRLFVAERGTAALHPISELLRRVIAATGYEAHVLSLTWGERRLANVQKLVRLASGYEAQEGRDLRGFLDHITHLEGSFGGREADAPVGDGELDAVRLLSIHAAKGLEFPVVCVADLGREPNSKLPDLLVDGAGGRVGLRLVGLGDPESKPALHFDELREERRAEQEEEEDRILYVACTRARERLLLSGAVDFRRWPQPRPGVAPIVWLAPALVPDAPKLAETQEQLTGTHRFEVDRGGGLLVGCLLNAPATLGEACPEPGRREPIDRIGPIERIESIPDRIPSMTSLAPSASPSLSFVSPVPASHSEVEVPMPLADPDGTMSYTSLAELERCGYRYYLERVLRIPENRAAVGSGEADGPIEARTRGTIVHMLLEAVDFTNPRSPSTREVADAARRIGARIGAREREEIASLLAAALGAEPARRLADGRRPRREHPFAFSIGADRPLVTGFLDLIVDEQDGRSLIVDYKSDRVTPGEDLEQLVVRDYGFQRLLYALAAIEAGAREVEVAHWFLERPEEWVTARFHTNERESLRKLLLGRIERVRAGGFAVRDTPHRGICLTCPGRGGLCSWGETHTMRERYATLESEQEGFTLNY